MARRFEQEILKWARTKRADEPYNYLDKCGCAVAQFLIASGRAKSPIVHSDPSWQAREGGPFHKYPVVVDRASCPMPNTFGAFADRLEKALAK